MEAPRRSKNFGRYITIRSIINVVMARFVAPTAQAIAEILGVDLSKWNWLMDFGVLFPQIKFGYIRGGYGIYRDERLDTYRNEFKAKGKPFGIYWFIYVGSPYFSVDDQVSAFLKVLNEGGWVLPPMADFENTVLPPAETTAWIQLFMAKLQLAMGNQKLAIYTSPGWWNAHVLRNAWAKLSLLIVAHWTTALTPILPLDWTEAFMWQFSADGNGLGRKYGSVSGDADMDLIRVVAVDIYNEIIGVPPTPPAPEPNTFEVLVDGLAIRSGGGTDFAYLGKRALGEKVTAQDFEIWIKDSRGWSAVRHNSQDFMKRIS